MTFLIRSRRSDRAPFQESARPTAKLFCVSRHACKTAGMQWCLCAVRVWNRVAFEPLRSGVEQQGNGSADRGRWETSADRRPVSARSPSHPFTSPSPDAGWRSDVAVRLTVRSAETRISDSLMRFVDGAASRKTNPRPRLSHSEALCDRLYAACSHRRSRDGAGDYANCTRAQPMKTTAKAKINRAALRYSIQATAS